MSQIIDAPLPFQSCFTAVVSSPPKTDYKFLSANNTFEYNVQSMDCFLNPTINPYYFPLHKNIFVNDLIRTGNIVEVVGNDIFIRKSLLTLSATSFSSLFSAVSAIPSQVETHQIKGYTSNHGTKMWVDINNGQVFDVISPNWTSVACSTLSSIDSKVIVDQSPTTSSVVSSVAKTDSGTINAGAWQIQCQNVGASDGVFAGAAIPTGKFAAPLTAPPGCLLPAITYNATGTTMVITIVSYN